MLDGWRRPNGLADRAGPGARSAWWRSSTRTGPTSPATPPGICLKSGNAALLRGSATALRSNLAIAEALRDGLAKAGLPADCVLLVDDVRHEAAVELMQLTDVVDCLIPRGGPALIQSIRDNATVPVIIDGDGNCHVYVDDAADLDTRARHRGQRQDPAPERVQRGRVAGGARGGGRRVPARGCAQRWSSRASSWSATPAPGPRVPAMGAATDDDFGARVPRAEAERRGGAVARRRDRRTSTGSAPATPRRSSPATSPRPARFTDEVDAGTVVVNASTRFTDGAEFGFGAEIGISTQKLHARGPMALRELTTYKYVVWGDGQIRN